MGLMDELIICFFQMDEFLCLEITSNSPGIDYCLSAKYENDIWQKMNTSSRKIKRYVFHILKTCSM